MGSSKVSLMLLTEMYDERHEPLKTISGVAPPRDCVSTYARATGDEFALEQAPGEWQGQASLDYVDTAGLACTTEPTWKFKFYKLLPENSLLRQLFSIRKKSVVSAVYL